MDLRNYLAHDREPAPSWTQGEVSSIPRLRELLSSRYFFYPGAAVDGHPLRAFAASHSVHVFVYADQAYTAQSLRKELDDRKYGVAGYSIHLSTLNDEDLHPWTCILERDANRFDDHGPKRIAVVFLKEEASDALATCLREGGRAPFAMLLEDYSVPGFSVGGGSGLERLARGEGVLPSYLLIGGQTAPWSGYAPAPCMLEAGGMKQWLRQLHIPGADFFESLGIADQERIHSQFLAWLLAPGNSALTDDVRAHLIRTLLARQVELPASENCIPQLVITELSHMDVVIVLSEHVLVIENKLKSRLSRGQLQKYDVAIHGLMALGAERGLWAGARRALKVFLNFSGETNANGWHDLDYADLLGAVRGAGSGNPFIESYASLLVKLLVLRTEYLGRHHQHPAVEENSGLKATERFLASRTPDLSPVERFLLVQRLDTLFVEALLHKLARQIEVPGRYLVGETRGHALLETTFFELKIRGAPADVVFRAGTQLQRATFKINLGAGESYPVSERAWISAVEADLDAAVIGAWDGQALSPHGKRRAYRSWTFQLPAGESLEESGFDDFSIRLNHLMARASRTWTAALTRLQQQGVVWDVQAVAPALQMIEPDNAD